MASGPTPQPPQLFPQVGFELNRADLLIRGGSQHDGQEIFVDHVTGRRLLIYIDREVEDSACLARLWLVCGEKSGNEPWLTNSEMAAASP